MALGMSEREAARKQALFERPSRAIPDPDWAGFVPGRIELLGKHTDYAGGRSLVCAAEQGLCLLARARSDPQLHLEDVTQGSRVLLTLQSRPPADAGWAVYPAAVARRIARDFGITRGMNLAFANDLPPAAGLSSSSVLCIGVFLALLAVNQLGESPAFRAAIPDLATLADYLGAVESGRSFGSFAGESGVGTLGGSQDQTAILCSNAGELLQCSFVPVRLERRVQWPPAMSLAIGVSGVTAEKTGPAQADYNAAAAAIAEILRRWNAAFRRNDHSLAAALASSPEARHELSTTLAGSPGLARRFEQFVTESEELVPQSAKALTRGELAQFGGLVDRSQAGAERGLGNQIPETVFLARQARTRGAVAASAFGAGFGGSVWAMVPEAGATEFLARWRDDYRAAFPARAEPARFFLTRPGPAAASL